MSLSLKNFKSYGPKTQTVEFGNVDAVGIGGRNGAGKSSLIEALTFALYGKAMATEFRELGDEALINDRAREAYVSVTFEKDGDRYTVERTIARKGLGKSRLVFGTLNEPIVDVKAVNEKIRSILEMDYDTFVSSTVIRQEEMDRLTAKPPAERKEILTKIFGLQAYESMRERAHEKGWQIKNQISELEATKNTLRERISNEETVRKRLSEHQTRVARLRERIRQIEAEKTEIENRWEIATERKMVYDAKEIERKTLAEQLMDDEDEAKQIHGKILEVGEAEKELKMSKTRLEGRERLSQKLQKLIEQREQFQVEKAKWQQKIHVLEQEIKEGIENHRKIRDYSIPECPVCRRPLDEPHRTELLKKYERTIIKLERERDQTMRNANDSEVSLIQIVEPAIKEVQRNLVALVELDRKIGELTEAASRLPQFRVELVRVEERALQRKNRISELEKTLEALAPTVESMKSLDRQRTRIENELISVERDLGRENAHLDRAEQDLDEIERDRIKCKEIEDQIGEKARTRWAYEFLEKEVFHKDGVPTNVLMEIVPEIELEASKILRDLSNGRMNVGFRFGRKTKTGKVTEELVIEAVEHGQSHPVGRYSGGERMRINLALRLGVSEVVARRSGYKGRIETLIIDEGFGPLDEEGRRATVEILQELKPRFRKMLVISHIEDVREAFEARLTVTKPEGGYSTISSLS